MYKLKNDSQGFSIIESILIIVIIGMLVFVGYLVYQRTHNKRTSKLSNNNLNIESGWKTYNFSDGGLSLNYPSNWLVQSQGGGDITIQPAGNGFEDNFLMILRVSNNQDLSNPPNDASNGSSVKLPNNLFIWTSNQNNSAINMGGNSKMCPMMEIINSSQTHFSYALSNGQFLSLEGGYCEGQTNTANPSYMQQISSPNWQLALNILKTIKF